MDAFCSLSCVMAVAREGPRACSIDNIRELAAAARPAPFMLFRRFTMRSIHVILVLAVVLSIGSFVQADWKPAAGPLMTRWAKDVSEDKVHAEYPRQQMVRKDWLNLNGVWQVQLGAVGEAPPVGQDLPDRILVPFPVESALSGVMKAADHLWYRRTFQVPRQWLGKRLLLHFGAVDWKAEVWLNGKEIGEHRGGYDPFTFDITAATKPDGDQELLVRVYDPSDADTQPRGKQVRKPGGIFYTSTTGIWRTVWLEPLPPAYIGDLKIVPDVDAGKVRVTVQAPGAAAEDTAKLTALDGQRVVATAEGPIGKPIELPIANAKLWTPDTPFLYDLRVELRHGAAVADTVGSYFGMRKIGIGKDEMGVTRILLNGKFVFQVGPLDQGFWPDGLYTAPTDAALKYDIEITKKLGFNMARKHVKVEPDRWYYWCDKLGLLVWQDMPSGDASVAPNKGEITRQPASARQYELELRRMIDALHNHPCIVTWVVFNEGWGQFDTKRITNWTKTYDPSRLVDCASGWNDMAVGDMHDIHVYPGPGCPEPEPKRAAVLGEFGGLGLGVDGHTWTNKTWGYRGTQSSADLTRKYEKLLRSVYRLKDEQGLSAAVYTQTTDVETEANGLLTYDRAVIKVDLDRVAAANRGNFSRVPAARTVLPTSQDKGYSWRYTLTRPAAGWFEVGFDDGAWQEGLAGFGTKGTPGAVVRTEWKTADIWLRREITLPDGPLANPLLLVHHDEDVEIYINGVLAAKAPNFTTDYEEMTLTAEGRAALKPGKNTLAVHCKQTTGGQYIDVGILDIPERR
jgi:hypothetical protein